MRRSKAHTKTSLTAYAATTTRTANEAKKHNGHVNLNYFTTTPYICQ